MKGVESHRWGLERVRQAIGFTLNRRDRALPHLAELRNFKIDGAQAPRDARLYVPFTAKADGPLLLYFHGGGFITGDLDTHDALCVRLAHEGGFRVLAFDYRLAPEAAFPAQLDDARAAARWVLANRAALGCGDIAVGGDSAGAYLAAAVAGETPEAFIAQVLIYPLMHLDEDVWAATTLRDARFVGRLAVQYIEAALGGATVRAPSLLRPGSLAAIPSVIVAGEGLDPCRPDAAAARDILSASGARVLYRDYPGLIHGFGNLTHASAACRRAVADIAGLARQALERAPRPAHG